MRAAVVQDETGRLRVREVPSPRLPRGGALLRMTAVGICGSDLHKLGHVPPGTVLGHEVTGVVERVGAGVRRFRPGDRIVTAHHVPCGRCVYCRGGNESQCDLFRSTNLIPGGWAERIAVPAPLLRRVAFRIPENLTDAEACLTEPLACCLRAVRRSNAKKGDTLVVIGLGPVGLLLCRLLRERGARLYALDRIADKMRTASEWSGAKPLPRDPGGAVEEVLHRTRGRGADQVILSAGAASTVPLALRMVRRGGTVHLFAGVDEGAPVDFDLNSLYKREVKLMSTYSSTPADLAEALRRIGAGVIPAKRLIRHRLPLSRIEEGIRLVREGKGSKVILEPDRETPH